MGIQTEDKIEAIVKLVFRGIIPLVFLICGVALFLSKVSGWGLLLGLPMIIIASVMIIFTYDEIIKKQVYPFAEELTRCFICGKLTPRDPGTLPEDAVCSACKMKIKEREDKKEKSN